MSDRLDLLRHCEATICPDCGCPEASETVIGELFCDSPNHALGQEREDVMMVPVATYRALRVAREAMIRAHASMTGGHYDEAAQELRTGLRNLGGQ